VTLQYLLDKKLIGPHVRGSGRYRGTALAQDKFGAWVADFYPGGKVSRLPVFQTDIWMSHPDVPSTIGVPTPDNLEEVVDFTFQLRLLDRSKNAWSSDGHLVNGLRGLTSSYLGDPLNPFLLGAEALGLLRCLIERDGLLLREMCRYLQHLDVVSRDDVATALPAIAEDALASAVALKLKPEAIKAGRRFVADISKTNAEKKSSAPGVLEHRSSPRLEWLTDLGFLSKDGTQKNRFEYRVTDRLAPFVDLLDATLEAGDDWSATVAVSVWKSSNYWTHLREAVSCVDERTALYTAYNVLRRPIGPAPLRDVIFITGLLLENQNDGNLADRVIQLTNETPGASLSGGRTTRSPQNIYMTDESLRALNPK